MTVPTSTQIGGQVVNEDSEPVADTWVFLRSRSTIMHPDDATAAVEALVATPQIRHPEYSGGESRSFVSGKLVGETKHFVWVNHFASSLKW